MGQEVIDRCEATLAHSCPLQEDCSPLLQHYLSFGEILGFLPSWLPYPFHVVIQSDSHAVSLAQHFTRHEGVEDAGAYQGQAEIEAEKPPVLHVTIELRAKQRGTKTGRRG